MPSVEIRAATPADVERISEIHVAAWRATYTGLIPDEALEERTIQRRIDQWSGHLDRPPTPDHRLFVVTRNRAVTGFAWAGPSDDGDVDRSRTVTVHALYLDPEARRGGLGRRLLDHVLNDFAARGFELATLYVLIRNDAARRFYERLGWTLESDVLKECLGDGVPAPQVRYRLELHRGAEVGP